MWGDNEGSQWIGCLEEQNKEVDRGGRHRLRKGDCMFLDIEVDEASKKIVQIDISF
jgi:hypothetical protein